MNVDSSQSTVIVIGPPPNQIGGMASVVGQMMSMTFADGYQTELLPLTLSPGDHESILGRIMRHTGQIRRLQKTIRRTQAAIVHIHTCSGFSFYRSALDMWVAQRLGCRAILHVHGATFDEFFDRQPRWRRRLIAWSLTRADRVVALSEGWRNTLRNMAPRARITVIENAVDLPPERPHDIDHQPCRFLLLARMDEWKGIDDLLAACVRLHRDAVPMTLTLAGPPGTAGDETTLQKKIHNRGLDRVVRYIGPVQGQAKTNLWASSDVYVQPSRHEGMPISLLEALAHGLPVIATRVGAVPEVIEHDVQGLLVPAGQPDLLADALADLAMHPLRRRALAVAARSLAGERFSTARFEQDLHALWHTTHAHPLREPPRTILAKLQSL